MIIAGKYSFNGGEEFINDKFSSLLREVEQCIRSIDKQQHKTKVSLEKTMAGKTLYNPVTFNRSFKDYLHPRGWTNSKQSCLYSTEFYTAEYQKTNPAPLAGGAFRDMDFVKGKLGVEVQFGKYSFMVYNVCAKMTIFKNLGVIEAGVEIVPIKALADEMSSGVSYFEQFVWDLQNRGVSDIDIPVLVIGIG